MYNIFDNSAYIIADLKREIDNKNKQIALYEKIIDAYAMALKDVSEKLSEINVTIDKTLGNPLIDVLNG